jgi:hypothetical protein
MNLMFTRAWYGYQYLELTKNNKSVFWGILFLGKMCMFFMHANNDVKPLKPPSKDELIVFPPTRAFRLSWRTSALPGRR